MHLKALFFLEVFWGEKKSFCDREIKVSKVPEMGASLNQNIFVMFFGGGFDGRSRGACAQRSMLMLLYLIH